MNEFIKNLRENIDALDGVELTPETNLASLPNWDSVALLYAMVMINSEYGVTLKVSDINSAKNIAQLYELVKSKK